MAKKRFILLDRDGTIIVEKEYLSKPEQVELLPNAAAGLKKMQKMDFGLIVITNQSGVGRDYFSAEIVDEVHKHIEAEFQKQGVHFENFLYCPHTPEDDCECRKPKTKLVDDAARILNFDPSECIVIGDKPCDIDLAQNLKATSILVRTGYGKEYEIEGDLCPNFITDDLLGAAQIIEKIFKDSAGSKKIVKE